MSPSTIGKARRTRPSHAAEETGAEPLGPAALPFWASVRGQLGRQPLELLSCGTRVHRRCARCRPPHRKRRKRNLIRPWVCAKAGRRAFGRCGRAMARGVAGFWVDRLGRPGHNKGIGWGLSAGGGVALLVEGAWQRSAEHGRRDRFVLRGSSLRPLVHHGAAGSPTQRCRRTRPIGLRHTKRRVCPRDSVDLGQHDLRR